MLLKKVATFKNKLTGKARINYLSGLWLNCQFRNQPDLSIDITINGINILANQTSQDLNDDYVTFDIHLPVVKMAKALKVNDKLDIVITDHNGKELIVSQAPQEAVYLKEFEYIAGDINTTLSHLPLINKFSIEYLSDNKKLKIIKNLFDANLGRDASEEIEILTLSLKNCSDMESKQVLDGLKYNREFLNLIINSYKPLINNPLYNFVKCSISSLMYLDAKSIIEHSSLDYEDKLLLLSDCVNQDIEKFKFVEFFPKSDSIGQGKWSALTEDQRKEYWPILACGFEYKRDFERISNYLPNYNWYLDTKSKDKNEAIRSIIRADKTKWFGMSIINYEYQTGASSSELITYLQEFIWANWDENYINIDCICYLLKKLVKREISSVQYKSINDILIELVRSRVEKCENDLYRQCLIECIVTYINYGIRTVNWSFVQLSEIVRPYYIFDDYYLSKLEYEKIKAFDNEYYNFASEIYEASKAIKSFVLGLSHNNPPSDNSIRSILLKLIFLRDSNIKFVDKWILSISRYCQLNHIESIYSDLTSIHELIGDYHGALILAESECQKQRIERMITENKNHARRKDSYWFETLIDARLSENENSRLEYLKNLYSFLQGIKVGQQYMNEDLVHLLTSEVIHYLIHGGAFSKVEEYLTFLNKAYVPGCTAVLTANWIINGDRNLRELNQLAKRCGEYGEFKWFIEDSGQTLENILSESAQEKVLSYIKQRYVYPYLQVLIYSCNAYENTRHKIIRESWLPQLKTLDIDYYFVVGDADESHIDGDKMCLSVLDTYEELPHKSVEMFRFAHNNSHHRYYYKLDDDCVLNIRAMFGDPAFLNQDYFGREVIRPLGSVNRSWHHQKSSSQEAKTSLDLSPEYSKYCDGSTGYVLSRNAASVVTEVSTRDEHRQLLTSSYFEDKLIGDLLAIGSIYPSYFGYKTVIRRNVSSTDNEYQFWEYGLLASKNNNVKVVHSESDSFRLSFGNKIAKGERSEWESNLLFRDPTDSMECEYIDWSQQKPILEKVSVDLTAIKNSKHIAIIVGKNESELLPNLLEHHRKIGIEHFLFVDNCSDDNSINYMLEQKDVSVFIATQEYRYSRFGVNWQETLCSYYGLGRWVLIIDTDELYAFPEFEDKKLSCLTSRMEIEGADTILSPMIDFYPKGSLGQAILKDEKPFYEICSYFDSFDSMIIEEDPSYGPFSNSIIHHGGLRQRIFGGYAQFPQASYLNQKFNLIKYNPTMRLVEGLHFMQGFKLSKEMCVIMHFKYHSTFHDKVIREINSGQHWNGAIEYKRYAETLEKNPNASLYDKNISKKFSSSKSLFKVN